MRLPSLRVVWALLATVITLTFATIATEAWRLTNFTKKLERKTASVAAVEASRLQNPSTERSFLYSKLALQPEANRFRRRLGKRFLVPGREISVSAGTLSIGTDKQAVRIVRTPDEVDEQVAISLNGGPLSLTWNGRDGARVNDRAATGDLRQIIERLAMDSPDQFVLAQLRGANYFAVAQDAIPEAAKNLTGYNGPVWNLVRIAEPSVSGSNKQLSSWRLYFINTATGLIDRVISREQGEKITAEISAWGNQNGEVFPTQITWRKNQQVIMDLMVSNVSYQAKQ